jgi:hypothetical protein
LTLVLNKARVKGSQTFVSLGSRPRVIKKKKKVRSSCKLTRSSEGPPTAKIRRLSLFFTLVAGPISSVSLELSDTRVYAPQKRDTTTPESSKGSPEVIFPSRQPCLEGEMTSGKLQIAEVLKGLTPTNALAW